MLKPNNVFYLGQKALTIGYTTLDQLNYGILYISVLNMQKNNTDKRFNLY